MSSQTLSAVLEKLFFRLCLGNFPCGNGSWKKTNPKAAETEETDALLDLLSCPHSPWQDDASWSPQAADLRRLAVISPERLHANFIYSYFTTLRIVDKDVSVIDNGLLKFSKLEELVLSANKISEISAENLPCTLKILELCANRLSGLNSLTCHPPPHLQYLGLRLNSLGSLEDVSHLTGKHWPQLVCLDLSDCEFEDQQALLNALSTLPCLRTLLLEGNPFTVAACYPGLTVDRLPQLTYLDTLWISPEERRQFRGLSRIPDLMVNWASAKVSVGRMRGIPDPMIGVDENVPDFPLVTYSYLMSYKFLSHQTAANLMSDSKPQFATATASHVTEVESSDADLPVNRTCEKTFKAGLQGSVGHPEESCSDMNVLSHSTSKLAWSECMDFSDTQTYRVSDLWRFKTLLNQGLYLTLEEEKVLSWLAPSEDVTVAKPGRAAKEKKGGKGKETPTKPSTTKDKSKDKKKKSVPELVHDPPLTRVLSSVHVPLHSLLKRGQKVDVLCDLGVLHQELEMEATQAYEKDVGRKIKEDKERGGSSRQKSTPASKAGTEKGRNKIGMEVFTDDAVSVPLHPVTVELRVELLKWKSESEVLETQLLLQSL